MQNVVLRLNVGSFSYQGFPPWYAPSDLLHSSILRGKKERYLDASTSERICIVPKRAEIVLKKKKRKKKPNPKIPGIIFTYLLSQGSVKVQTSPVPITPGST